MTGRGSKNKGSRLEYAVRDYMRELGWDAYRVPASGAAEGFKGDVRATKDGQVLVFEVKARKDSFKTAYEILGTIVTEKSFWYAGYGIHMSYDLSSLLVDHVIYEKSHSALLYPKRSLNKLINMSKWLKGSDILVIKDNNKPLIFIKYLVPNVATGN